jgi:hypothetical protein
MLTEAKWLAAIEPYAMLYYLQRKVSARKLRLLFCACVRRSWSLLRDQRSRRAVEQAERFADGLVSKKELAAARAACPASALDLEASRLALAAAFCAAPGIKATGVIYYPYMIPAPGAARDADKREAVALVRELFGNPFRPVEAPEHWPATVIQLAEALYAGEHCAFALHDALLEANLSELAEHFRAPEQWHPKGCWALDLILGKK